MKDFHEMTADELQSYHGPVHWARITALSPDGKSRLRHDLEHPSAELLQAHLRKFSGVRIHARGVVENFTPTEEFEGIDYPSQTF